MRIRLDVSEHVVFSYWDLDISMSWESEKIDRVKELITDYWYIEMVVVDYLIWIDTRCSRWSCWDCWLIDRYYCTLVQMDMRYWSVLDETICWTISRLVIVFRLLKVSGKILSDRNTCIVPLFYRLHGNIVHIVIVTIIDIVIVVVLSQ